MARDRPPSTNGRTLSESEGEETCIDERCVYHFASDAPVCDVHRIAALAAASTTRRFERCYVHLTRCSWVLVLRCLGGCKGSGAAAVLLPPVLPSQTQKAPELEAEFLRMDAAATRRQQRMPTDGGDAKRAKTGSD